MHLFPQPKAKTFLWLAPGHYSHWGFRCLLPCRHTWICTISWRSMEGSCHTRNLQKKRGASLSSWCCWVLLKPGNCLNVILETDPVCSVKVIWDLSNLPLAICSFSCHFLVVYVLRIVIFPTLFIHIRKYAIGLPVVSSRIYVSAMSLQFVY